MSIVKTLMSLGFFSVFSFSVFAADIPEDVIGSQKFDAMRCITENTDTCINAVCLTSEQRDCQSTCQKMAQQKCQQQRNE